MSALGARGHGHLAPRRQLRDRSEWKLGRRLQSPLVLILQGFLIGSIMVLTLDPFAAPAPVASGGGSMLSNLQA